MAVATAIQTNNGVPKFSFTQSIDPAAGLLETAIHEVAEMAISEIDLSRDIQVINGQLDRAGREAFTRVQNDWECRLSLVVDAAIRLGEPVKAMMVEAVRENFTTLRLECALREMASNYSYEHPELDEPDGAA